MILNNSWIDNNRRLHDNIYTGLTGSILTYSTGICTIVACRSVWVRVLQHHADVMSSQTNAVSWLPRFAAHSIRCCATRGRMLCRYYACTYLERTVGTYVHCPMLCPPYTCIWKWIYIVYGVYIHDTCAVAHYSSYHIAWMMYVRVRIPYTCTVTYLVRPAGVCIGFCVLSRRCII